MPVSAMAVAPAPMLPAICSVAVRVPVPWGAKRTFNWQLPSNAIAPRQLEESIMKSSGWSLDRTGVEPANVSALITSGLPPLLVSVIA